MVYANRERVTIRESLSGENLVYVIVLLVFHVTIWEIMWKLGVIGYKVFLLLIMPAVLIAGIVSIIYSIGARRGWVREPSKHNEKKLILILILSIIMSASLMVLTTILL